MPDKKASKKSSKKKTEPGKGKSCIVIEIDHEKAVINSLLFSVAELSRIVDYLLNMYVKLRDILTWTLILLFFYILFDFLIFLTK